MRLMVISHSYMEPLPRDKWRALRDVDPEIEILVVTPKRWNDPEMWANVAQPESSERLGFVPVDTVLEGWIGRYFFSSPKIAWLFKRFRPDVVQVEAEPWQAVYVQAALLRRCLAPRAKLVCFTWWNTPRKVTFPFSVVHRRCLQATDLVIAGNHGALDILKAHGYHGWIEILPQLGLDDKTFKPAPRDEALVERHGLTGRFVIGYVGRLTKRKGVDTLLDAAARLGRDDWRLLIVGNGPERAALEARCERLDIADRVEFGGAIARDAIANYLNCMDVLVLPSKREQWEQFGHVLIEAMACETPVIGSTSGEIPHVIGDAGLVFPMLDADALAGCLRRMMDDRSFVARCKSVGRALVEDRYTHEAIGRRLAQIYSELVADVHNVQDTSHNSSSSPKDGNAGPR